MNTDNANNLPESLSTPPLFFTSRGSPERKLITFLTTILVLTFCVFAVGGYALFSRLGDVQKLQTEIDLLEQRLIVPSSEARKRVEELQVQVADLQNSLRVTPSDVQAQVVRLQERLAQLDRNHSLSLVMESSSQPIIALDHEQEVVVWSRGAELLFGRSKSEMLGQTIEFMFADEAIRDSHISAFYTAMRKDSTYRFERQIEVTNGDGELLPATLEVIVDPGNLAVAFFTLENGD